MICSSAVVQFIDHFNCQETNHYTFSYLSLVSFGTQMRQSKDLSHFRNACVNLSLGIELENYFYFYARLNNVIDLRFFLEKILGRWDDEMVLNGRQWSICCWNLKFIMFITIVRLFIKFINNIKTKNLLKFIPYEKLKVCDKNTFVIIIA